MEVETTTSMFPMKGENGHKHTEILDALHNIGSPLHRPKQAGTLPVCGNSQSPWNDQEGIAIRQQPLGI